MRIPPQSAETEFKALMLAALAGDGVAYGKLLGALTPHLRAYFRRRLGAVSETEDLVQETLIAIHTRRASFDPTQPFTAWLHAIARYKLIDHFRRSRVRRTLPLEHAECVTDDADARASEAVRDIDHLLQKLPANKRDLIRRVKLEGMTTADVAASTGLTETAVKVGVHRALKALAKLLGERDQT